MASGCLPAKGDTVISLKDESGVQVSVAKNDIAGVCVCGGDCIYRGPEWLRPAMLWEPGKRIIKSQCLHLSKEVANLHINVCPSLVSSFCKDHDQSTWRRKGVFHLTAPVYPEVSQGRNSRQELK